MVCLCHIPLILSVTFESPKPQQPDTGAVVTSLPPFPSHSLKPNCPGQEVIVEPASVFWPIPGYDYPSKQTLQSISPQNSTSTS